MDNETKNNPDDNTSENREKTVLGVGKWLSLEKVGGWEWVRRVHVTGVVGLYAFTDEDEVVLVEQPRAPLGHARVLEIPAGLVGDILGQEGEPMAAAAQRELIEETGYESANLREIIEVPTSPGITEETVHLYVARGLRKVGAGGGDESEEIEVHLVPMAKLAGFLHERMQRGAWIDPKVFAAPFFFAL